MGIAGPESVRIPVYAPMCISLCSSRLYSFFSITSKKHFVNHPTKKLRKPLEKILFFYKPQQDINLKRLSRKILSSKKQAGIMPACFFDKLSYFAFFTLSSAWYALLISSITFVPPFDFHLSTSFFQSSAEICPTIYLVFASAMIASN